MRSRCSWDDLLPMDEISLAAKHVVKVWAHVSKKKPDSFKYSIDEPKITEHLHEYLVKLSSESGLSGFWINEAQRSFHSDDGKKLLARIRKDITYYNNLSGTRIELIFEFKKLSGSNKNAYRGKHGMQRFVDGYYGIGQPLAIMVALVKENITGTIEALNRSLSQKGIQTELKMVHDKSGNYIRRPSNVLLGIAEFDTEHRRPPEKAPSNGTTTLAHIFLGFGS